MFEICFAYESIPNLNIKHHLLFGNEKKNNCKKHLISFFKMCLFPRFNPCTAYEKCFVFVFLPFFVHLVFSMLECESGGRWERQKHTTGQANVSSRYSIQEWRQALGEDWAEESGGGAGGSAHPKRNNPLPPKIKIELKKDPKEDMYNHLCGPGNTERPSDGRRRPPMPHTFSCNFFTFSLTGIFLSFYFFKHTNNSHYIILPN